MFTEHRSVICLVVLGNKIASKCSAMNEFRRKPPHVNISSYRSLDLIVLDFSFWGYKNIVYAEKMRSATLEGHNQHNYCNSHTRVAFSCMGES